jgi:hypothetical protein
MGKRSRRRGRDLSTHSAASPAQTDDYADAEGNVLTLRRTVSPGTVRKLTQETPGGAAASADDLWQRRGELLFERFAVSWTIAGLPPLTKQQELLGRYRLADEATRRWVRERLDEHLARHQPELTQS